MQSSSWRRRHRSSISLIAALTLASGSIPAASVLAQGRCRHPSRCSATAWARTGSSPTGTQVVGYFGKLAAASPAVSIETLGEDDDG